MRRFDNKVALLTKRAFNTGGDMWYYFGYNRPTAIADSATSRAGVACLVQEQDEAAGPLSTKI